jgi:hypothetical protein
MIATIENKYVTKPWIGNRHGSLIFTIPKKILKKCDITDKSYITIEDNEKGQILIKKLDLGDSK